MSCYPKIYDIVRQIPYGQVATYGQIADLAGLVGKARVVGLRAVSSHYRY